MSADTVTVTPYFMCDACGASNHTFPSRRFFVWPVGDEWAGETACTACFACPDPELVVWEPIGAKAEWVAVNRAICEIRPVAETNLEDRLATFHDRGRTFAVVLAPNGSTTSPEAVSDPEASGTV